MQKNWLIILSSILFLSCTETEKPKELPFLGPYNSGGKIQNSDFDQEAELGQIRAFEFVDQDGNAVNHSTINGKIYVTDFFFTSCPTICPKMKQQMLRIYEEFEAEEDLILLSHSIDPKRDSVGRLKTFADKLGITSDRWHLVTGEKDSIYSMAKHYMIAAQKDDLALGGYAHSGQFLLIDKKRQIRGIYDGTVAEDVDILMEDIRILLGSEEE
ncbi:MAG: SCO family protein [Flavobacteriales bacterium]|mgnify:FL=1|jgi:protein SCO1|nr:SCO family protein [Flavobacteriales bacterium]NCG30503.1 SCO family protein [Bacteroidota bacterium]MBT3962621.1 SCO family protein [Flavobacteriales bacterium]MBT4705373.1 SCO family protein [Flavobacteriales bacterium]MBT4929876.1 SCO family protein [Flavobacteriales bacterium]